MKTIENAIKTFQTSKIIFEEGVSEENIAKAIELANQIDYYFSYIDDGAQYRAAGRKNRILVEKLIELGCTEIVIPFNGRDCELKTETYCKGF
jgi:hypothetical protein